MKLEFSRVTAKAQVVIPAKLRRQLGIRKGTQVSFLVKNHSLVLQPLTEQWVNSLRGSLKGKPSVLDFLMKQHRRERSL